MLFLTAELAEETGYKCVIHYLWEGGAPKGYIYWQRNPLLNVTLRHFSPSPILKHNSDLKVTF